jgi:IS30 family transposase
MENRKKSYKRFGWDTWHEIFNLLECGFSRRKIAKSLGRHISSISRGLARSGPWNRCERRLPWYEKAWLAYVRDEMRQSRKRRRRRIPDLVVRRYIHEKLEAGWTPELISGRIKHDHSGKSISAETIYQYIYGEAKELVKYLVIAGNRGNRKRTSRRRYRSVIPAAEKRSIEERPVLVLRRLILGHWEIDTLVSGKSLFCVLTVIERRSRFRFHLKLPFCRAEEARKALVHILQQFPPEYMQSITMDNGAENAMHREIERELGVKTYFCHPYAAHERGSVEYANRQFRTKFPKGTDFALVCQRELDQVADHYNNRPMKCLGFRTPYEVFLPALQAQRAAA